MKNKSLYRLGEAYLKFTFSLLFSIAKKIISPSWWYASTAKKGLGKKERAEGIIARNYIYLFISILLTFLLGIFYEPNELQATSDFWCIVLCIAFYIITWSRCNEIFFAFIQDALDKSENTLSESNLTFRKRIELALLSYIELILNYSILFLLMPTSWFSKEFESIVDTVYLSGVTITTLGYGDFSPVNWLPKFLVIHEVLVGFTLIIVSFAIYAGKDEIGSK